MKNEPKKPDLRDQKAPPTSVDHNERSFAEQPMPSDTGHIVKPGPDQKIPPGQTTHQ
ncbi:MAG TPA: hypothetical protein VHL34_21940 [Rhizomicrobium sp.]|jgi:hypothetical protein|nr:hypothetical protein [Rhizomicrobium sp.]